MYERTGEILVTGIGSTVLVYDEKRVEQIRTDSKKIGSELGTIGLTVKRWKTNEAHSV
jgi:ribosomal protein S19